MDAVEVYVLCTSRSKMLADEFLNRYAAQRKPIASEYPYPEFVDEPEITYSTPDEVMTRLEQDSGQSYSIYWDCIGANGPEQVMLFYTRDGHMIAGLGGPRVSFDSALSDLSEIVKGDYGYVTSGSCPPETYEEFVSLSRNSTLPSVVNGKLRVDS